jgi:hypothetical protein
MNAFSQHVEIQSLARHYELSSSRENGTRDAHWRAFWILILRPEVATWPMSLNMTIESHFSKRLYCPPQKRGTRKYIYCVEPLERSVVRGSECVLQMLMFCFTNNVLLHLIDHSSVILNKCSYSSILHNFLKKFLFLSNYNTNTR